MFPHQKCAILFISNGAKYKPISNMLLPTQETRERKREIAKMNCFEEWKLVIAMVVVNFALAIVNILFKKVLNGGMNHLLIVTYRQAISAIFLTPIAYFLERATLTQYFFLIGLKYTSATFTCAFINMVPVNTFLMALPFGLEKLDMRKKSGRAKVLGTLVCISGALVLTLYKGIAVTNVSRGTEQQISDNYGTRRWVIGSVVLIAGSLLWSSWFLIQAKIGKRYPFQYSSTAIMSFFSAIQSAILYLVIDLRGTNISISAWIVKRKLDILSVTYAGMVGSGICYVAMAWCVKQKGPVFTSAFSPFVQIFVAIFDVSILHEQIYVGSVLGSILVIGGMYILLWGKGNDTEACKHNNNNNSSTTITVAADHQEENDHHQVTINKS